MAEAIETTGLSLNPDVLNLADDVLRALFDDVLKKWDDALEPQSVDGVHDLRVAIRRLRSATRNFNVLVEGKPFKPLGKDLKKIAGALGAARDRDVAIIAFEKLKHKSPDKQIKSGIAELIAELKRRREEARSALKAALTDGALKRLRRDFDKAIVEAAKGKRSARKVSFNNAGRELAGRCFVEFFSLVNNIYEPFNDQPLHELRIAAKRLRYSIELYGSCWKGSLKPFAEELARLQDFLGEVHDADVWLSSTVEKLREDSEANPAHLWLLSEFVEMRTQNYRGALKLWSEWLETGFLEELNAAIGQRTM